MRDTISKPRRRGDRGTEGRGNLRRLVDEQSALRQVATLVAAGAEATAVFAAVAEETGHLLGATSVNLARFTDDGFNLTMAGWSIRDTHVPVGTRLPLVGETINGIIHATRAPARVDSYEHVGGELAAVIRRRGIRAEVGAPVLVAGAVWGGLIAGWDTKRPPPRRAESDIARFAELVAMAVSSAQARAELEGTLAEQAALRRIATLVASRAVPSVVFASVAEEVGRVLFAELTDLWRYTDGAAEYVASWSDRREVVFPARLELDGTSVGRLVLDTGAPARIDDYGLVHRSNPGSASATFSRLGITAAIGAPVVVDGRLWGVISACRLEGEAFPPGSEDRLAAFTSLLATAISNAAHYQELLQSRARIVAAGDEARRRIERNLHDGIQQRLISIGLDLRLLEARDQGARPVSPEAVGAIASELEDVVRDVREISRGLHPAILVEAGLEAAVRALIRRSPIAVELHIEMAVRPAESSEVAAYYVIAESLSNVAKHSRASAALVTVRGDDDTLNVAVQDDGVGDASPDNGSGLIGLADRVEALGGRFDVASRPGEGTVVSALLPLRVSLDEAPIRES
jgi:signal transduction histidine kinase